MAAFGGPPIDGLGTTCGFKLIIENRGNLAPEELDKITGNIIDAGNNSGVVQDLSLTSRADTPWLNLELDRSKCLALGVQVVGPRRPGSRSTWGPTMSTISTISVGPGR